MHLGAIFAYFPILEFWRRARPTQIDDSGVEMYFLGRPLRRLSWPEVRAITKMRYQHPMGYFGESVWLRGDKMPSPNADARGTRRVMPQATNNPWRKQLALFPGREAWVTSNI